MQSRQNFLIAAIMTMTLISSQASAEFYKVHLEEDMGEGITLSVNQPAESIGYTYDNSVPQSEDLLTEGIPSLEPKKDSMRFRGDPSVPSLANLMTEGICIENFPKHIAKR